MFEIIALIVIVFVGFKVFSNKETKQAVTTTAQNVRTGVQETSQKVHEDWEASKFEARVQSIMADPALVTRIIEEDRLRSDSES